MPGKTALPRIFTDQTADQHGQMTIETTRAGLVLAHGSLTREIIGAFYEVYNELGFGFSEAVYQRALPVALLARGVSCELELAFVVSFKGEVVGNFRADLIVGGKVIVECKTADQILPIHETQILNYLKATGIPLGLILNFGPKAMIRRLILTTSEAGSAVIRS